MCSSDLRYLMTVIATASNPRFSVSRVDIDRPGNTYTVDTLRDLRAERGDDVDLFFITGADEVRQILTWRGAEQKQFGGASMDDIFVKVYGGEAKELGDE